MGTVIFDLLINFTVSIAYISVFYCFTKFILVPVSSFSYRIILLISGCVFFTCIITSFAVSLPIQLLAYGLMFFFYIFTQHEITWFVSLFYSVLFINLTRSCQFVVFILFKILNINFLLSANNGISLAFNFAGILILFASIYIIKLISGNKIHTSDFHNATGLILIIIPTSILFLMNTVFRLLHIGDPNNKSECILIFMLASGRNRHLLSGEIDQ